MLKKNSKVLVWSLHIAKNKWIINNLANKNIRYFSEIGCIYDILVFDASYLMW